MSEIDTSEWEARLFFIYSVNEKDRSADVYQIIDGVPHFVCTAGPIEPEDHDEADVSTG